jgi:MerR family redox-sensitive transcriptional activator SoxR
MTIGEVAARSGLRTSAIRYYESQGLLPIAPRSGGKRVYDATILERLAVIDLAKTAGFNLAEIRSVLGVVGGRQPSTAWKTLTKRKRAEIDEQMRMLALMKQVVTSVGRCRCATLEDCGRAFRVARAKYARRHAR